jgi:hypothetical protein
MAAALPALAIGGAVTSAIGAIGGGIASSQAASYQAQVNRNNATTATQNSTYALEAGSVQEQEAGQKAAGQLGQVRASMAANNVDVNSGSAVDVQKSQRETGLLSEEDVSNNAALTAYGYQTQATGFQAQAGLEQGQASTAIPGALLSAGGGLLSNVSTIPTKFAWPNSEVPAGFGAASGAP